MNWESLGEEGERGRKEEGQGEEELGETREVAQAEEDELDDDQWDAGVEDSLSVLLVLLGSALSPVVFFSFHPCIC